MNKSVLNALSASGEVSPVIMRVAGGPNININRYLSINNNSEFKRRMTILLRSRIISNYKLTKNNLKRYVMLVSSGINRVFNYPNNVNYRDAKDYWMSNNSYNKINNDRLLRIAKNIASKINNKTQLENYYRLEYYTLNPNKLGPALPEEKNEISRIIPSEMIYNYIKNIKGKLGNNYEINKKKFLQLSKNNQCAIAGSIYHVNGNLEGEKTECKRWINNLLKK